MRLPREEALAIAKAWGEELRGRVSLQVPHHSGRLHPRDEQWIALELQKLARHSVRLEHPGITRPFIARVRDIVEVWRAIACCPGFTQHEDPVFWRSVISHAHRKSHVRQRGCSDEFTFFEHVDEFPRFRLFFEDRLAVESTNEDARREAEHIDIVCRQFFQLGERSAPSDAFVETMARLQPCISTARYARRVPIALDLPSWDTVHLYPVVTRLLEELREHPVFEIAEISVDEMRVFPQNDITVSSLQAWMQIPGVRISDWWWKSGVTAPIATCLVTGLNNSSLASLRTLVLSRHVLTNSDFAGLCAALPQARGLQQLRLSTASGPHDWSWLTYALFHPDTAHSTWRELSVDTCVLTHDDIKAMRAVRGVGIVALLPSTCGFGPSERSNLAFRRVHLQCETVMREAPSSSATIVALIDSVIGTLYGAMKADEAWYHVIVPGLGAGWVEAHHVEESVTQPVLESRRSHLTHFRAAAVDGSYEDLCDLICLLGSSGSLKLVEVGEHTPFPASQVGAILSHCEGLESLNVVQDGSLWTGSDFFLCRPLRTLRVCCSSAEQVESLLRMIIECKKELLPSLEQLRLEYLPGEEGQVDEPDGRDRDRIVAAATELLRNIKTITHLSLHGVTPIQGNVEYRALSYDEYRERALSTLSLSESQLDLNQRPRVAFVGALRASGVVTPDIARVIFSFVGRRSRNAFIFFRTHST